MAQDTVGYAALQIIPSLQGIRGNLGSNFGPIVEAGRRAGRDAGQAVASGIEAAQASVRSASQKLGKARDAEADAAGKVRAAEVKLQELRDKGASNSQVVAAEERLNTARRGVARAAEQATSAVEGLARAEREVEQATDQAASATEGFGSRLSSAFGGLSGTAKQLAALTAAAGGVGGAFELGMGALERGAAIDKLNARLGATGQLAADYGADAGRLYAGNFAATMEDATLAVESVATAFPTAGFEGEKTIDQLSQKALAFSDIFDQDLPGSVQAAAQLINTGLAGDATEAFDLMTAAAQRVTPAMRDELPELTNEYGTFFSSLGFSGQEAFGMLVSASDQGLIAMDKVGDALKETGIRATDIGDAGAVAAFESMGMSAEDMANRLLAGGQDARGAYQEMVDGLLAIENPAEQASAAIALFGTPLEDLNKAEIPAFLQAMASAGTSMAGFEGSLDEAASTMYGGPLAAIQTFGRGLEANFQDKLSGIMPALGQFTGALDENEGSVLAAAAGMAGLGGSFAAIEQGKGIFDSVTEGVGSAKESILGIKDSAMDAAEGIKGAWGNVKTGAHWAGEKAKAAASFVATTASATANAVSTAAAWTAAQARLAAGWAAAQARAVASFVATSASAVGSAAATAAAWAAASARTVAANAAQALSFVASRAAMVAGAAATGAITAAQWLLNAAMSANPIGLVVIALTALVGGLVLAYNKSETFRAIVTAAWEGIKNAAAAAWSGFIKPALDGIVAGAQWVGDKFVWMADASMAGLTLLRDGATAVADWIVDKYTGFLGFITDMPGRISAAASGMFDGIKNAFRAAINWVIGKWNNLSFTLPSIEVFGQRIGGATLSTPDIPMLASGGRAGRRRDGMLWGPGTGISDSILGLNAEGVPTALVSAGEMVVNAQQTAANLPLLQAINNGLTVPRELVGSLAALAGGDYDGRLSRFGVEEDNPLVGALLDTRSGLRSIDGLLGRGDYDGGLSRFGVEEDNPMVAGLLGIRSLLRDGDYTGNLNSAFGIEEDNPLIGALLAVRGRLPRLAGGGVVSAKDLDEFAKGVEGAKYVWGGVNWGDCSGAVSGLVNYAVGEDPWGSRGATGNFREWLAGKGLQPGLGPAGSLNIGWFNGGPYGGHTAATLPNGVNFEMGGARGDGQYGGAAAGASDPDFTDHAHLPPEAFLGGDPDLTGGVGGGGSAPAFAGGAGGGGGLSFGGSGGGGSVSSTGGSFMSPEGQVQLADGAAIPVWVVNWPGNSSDMFADDSAAAEMTSALTDNTAALDGAELGGTGDMVTALDDNTAALQDADMSGQVGGTGVDNQFQGREQEDWGKRVTDAGGNFVKANADQFMSDLGVGQVGGVTGAVINDLVPYLMDLVANPPQQFISNFHGFDLAESMRRDDVRRKQASLTYQRRGAL